MSILARERSATHANHPEECHSEALQPWPASVWSWECFYELHNAARKLFLKIG
jgi:hypothetical protein